MDFSVAKSSFGSMPTPILAQSSGDPAPADIPLLLVDEQKMVDIEKPHHNDVLCGRGVTTNRHPGNESFRSLVGLNKVRIYFAKNKIPYSFLDRDSRLDIIVREECRYS